VLSYSIIVSFQGLFFSRGFNKDVKQTILKRQVYIVLIRFIPLLPRFVLFQSRWSINFLLGYKYFDEVPIEVELGVYVVYSLTGIFWFIFLVCKPSFQLALKYEIYKLAHWIGCITHMPFEAKTFEDNSKNPKNAFLCVSMNMELVCAILKGI